jgi:hypothetical protein
VERAAGGTFVVAKKDDSKPDAFTVGIVADESG